MTVVETAERKARWRAIGFLFLAVLAVTLMIFVSNGEANDFVQGLWFGVILGSALNLLPIKRWLRPNSDVDRLLEDEGTRENRLISCTMGFWGAIVAAMALGLLSRFSGEVSARDFGQLIATTGIVLAMVTFGTLELRAAR